MIADGCPSSQLENSAQVASVGVVAEAIDESARKFYLHHEFAPLRERFRDDQLPELLCLPIQLDPKLMVDERVVELCN